MQVLKAVAVAAALCGAVIAQARPLEEIQKSGTIVLASEGQYAPFNFFKGKQLTGYEIEVGEAVAKKMGLKFEWKTVGFDALLTGLAQDRWDLVIASHGVTEERAKAVTFTLPHYCSGGQIVSLTPSISKAGDLSGKVVAVQTGTSYMDNVKKVAGVKEVKNFPTDEAARSALGSKRVDAWVTDRFVAKEMLAKAPKAGFKAGDMLFIEHIAAAVSKGNQGLADAWNKALKEAIADGTVGAISKKYFQEDITCK
ncbi:ABC transporter substrate-binding protein [Comamonas sp. UBA7528]|jgi:ABC-type amino acid transport/signal transduction systems, periplasmic component/domain|uniref:ABC transporter substrate-binding protein n=1 Tax=Comamonas sp. UBA7528 TaxID=1946391 RepID=UPI001B62A4BB|nr:ABC transporter substrate-binding protein [Comamonas sp. UBA7528]MBP7353855.1 amino acid ABC transporter substrate-binding protein [Comamonas sp.]